MDVRFGWLNYSILVVYLGAMAAVGLYFSRRQKTTEDYFPFSFSLTFVMAWTVTRIGDMREAYRGT